MQFRYFKADHATSIEDAKKQYYRLCLRWHPDRPNGDEEAMKATVKEHNEYKGTKQTVVTRPKVLAIEKGE